MPGTPTFVIALVAAVAVWLVARAVIRMLRVRRLAAPPYVAPPPPPVPQPWPRLDGAYTTTVARMLYFARVPRAQILRTLIACAVVCVLGIIFSIPWIAPLAIVVGVCAVVLVVSRANRRRKLFMNQIPDALDALVQSLRAGFTMPQALALVERETYDPICRVFGALARADEYRVPFTDAIAMIDRTLDCFEWTLVTEAMALQHRVGGNLAAVLGTIAERLRDRHRVEQELQSATASGKFSALIIASLAPLSFALFYFFFPGYLDQLLYSTIGNLLLIFAVVLEAIGFFWIWRLVSLVY